MGLILPALHLPPDVKELIYLRTLPADHRYWAEAGDHRLLTPEVAAPAMLMARLKEWEAEWLRAAVVARSCRTAVVTGRYAARLWGVGVHGVAPDGVADLLLPGKGRPSSMNRWGGSVRYHSADLPKTDYTVAQSLRLTTPWRAVRDIAIRDTELEAIVAMDSLRHCMPGDDERHKRLILGSSRYHGKARVRRLLELSVPNSESPLETWGREQLRRAAPAEVRTVELQVVVVAGGRSFRVDMLVNGWLIVEFDGAVKYRDCAKALANEAKRQHLLVNAGWVVLRVDHRDLAGGAFVPMIVRALREKPRSAA